MVTTRDAWITRFARVIVTTTFIALAVLLTYGGWRSCSASFHIRGLWGETLRETADDARRHRAGRGSLPFPTLIVVLIIIATRVVIAVTNAFFDAVERGTIVTTWTSADTARASRRLIAAALWLFAAVIAYP